MNSLSHGGSRGSLSFNDSDNSLWCEPNSASSHLLQYDTSGVLLNSLTTSVRSNNAWGSEISVSTSIDVPEPSTLTILGLSLLGLASRRIKKQA